MTIINPVKGSPKQKPRKAETAGKFWEWMGDSVRRLGNVIVNTIQISKYLRNMAYPFLGQSTYTLE